METKFEGPLLDAIWTRHDMGIFQGPIAVIFEPSKYI
jgi:hypothetical protein